MNTPQNNMPALSLREQWDGHLRAREALLENAIHTTGTWIEGIADGALGAIGREFHERSLRAGLRHVIDVLHAGSRAAYTSFSYGGRQSFVNRIVYGPAAEEDLAVLFSARVHETTHALQKMNCAALHASPFNRNTRIVVCPRDWITLEERCEQDAYTKQALFNSLLAESGLPEVLEMTGRDALSVKTFERIRKGSKGVAEALVDAARRALRKSFFWDNPQAVYRFQNHYHDHALNNFMCGLRRRNEQGDHNLVFVRIEPEDIAAIGASCGPNSFGDQGPLPEFLAPPTLLPETHSALFTLNEKLGIADESALPTLTDALAAIGMTRAQFINSSYGRDISLSLTPPAPQP